ncbi:MAG: HEPN domain-containing protein [Campylobacterota bacterium]|nr:HEPN domain-containing protein [Campylobacterota bacterium]
MKKTDIKSSADMFFYKAGIDFNSAKALFELFEANKLDIDIDKVYFELQQSAEKLLKAILSKNGIKFGKTHDIDKLISLCDEHSIELIDNVDELVSLNDYAVEGRYDIICDDIEDSGQYFIIVEKLINFINLTKEN